ncbi:caspase-1-like isoform X2 [Chironomus tepperi]
MAFESSFLSTLCWPFRQISTFFRNIFHNPCRDSTVGRVTRRLRRWANRIMNIFRFRSTRQATYHVNDFPTLVLPKINASHEYNMNHEKRGIAVIYNQEHFEPHTGFKKKRKGTDVDLKALIKTFERLEFKVMYYSDLSKAELIKSLEKVSSKDHSKSDCIIITILSHGELNKIYTRDDHYNISLITSFFTDESCPSLKDKPKIFFVQSCRGGQADRGHQMTYSSNYRLARVDMGSYEEVDVTATGTIHSQIYPQEMVHNPPNNPDFLIVRSTMPNYVSFRNEVTGSWFIQELCTELDKSGNELDILTLLTYVNGQVAMRESKSNDLTGYKQTLCISSMLTKRLIFHVKNRLNQS